DNETVGIETWINERYISDVSKKIRANIRFKIEKGEYLGHAPYGYCKLKEEKNKLCIDSETAPFVKLIYEKYRQGYGYCYIAKHLDSINCHPPSEKHNPGSYGHWNAVGVRRILNNRVYIGDTVQGVSERISFKSKKTRKLPESRWVITKGTHEPIIDFWEFEEVQRIIESKRNGSGPHKGKLHVLKGVMFCGSCGSSMFARIRKDRPPGYVCSSYVKHGRQKCISHHTSEDYVLGIIIEELKRLLYDSTCIQRLQLLFEKDRENTASGMPDIQRLEQLLMGKQKQQDILYMDKLEGKITEQLFIRMNANIENRIDQLRHEIVKAKSRETESNGFMEVLNEARNNIRDRRITNEIVKLMVNRIIVYEEGEFEQFSKVSARADDSEGAVVIEFNYSGSIEIQG
ncbi:MAG TPA: recombinase family protein, partial [Clostridia bacterium]|nr:recombinase family protein [Clostridia bacterium]